MLLYDEPTITMFSKAQKMSLLRNTERMSKLVLQKRLIGARRREKPKKMWFDKVQKDLKSMEVEEWREKSRNRQEWKKIVYHFQYKDTKSLLL